MYIIIDHLLSLYLKKNRVQKPGGNVIIINKSKSSN